MASFDNALAKYLHEQAALGKLRRRGDWMVTARVFFAMLLVYVFSQEYPLSILG